MLRPSWAALGLVLQASVACAQVPDVLSPDDAVALALAAHPDVRAAEAAQATADATRRARAVLLANPFASLWATPDGTRLEADLTQPLSLTGAGWHARAAARATVDARDATLARTRREVAAATRRAWVDAVVARGRLDVAREGADLAERLAFAVQRQHEEGEASSLDLRLARLARAQAAARQLDARQDLAAALRTLSDRVLQPVAAEQLPDDPLAAAPGADAETTPADRADVRAAHATVQAARAGLRQARASAVPPVSVGVGIAREDGQTFVGPAVGWTLPVFARAPTARAQALGALAVAEADAQRTEAVAVAEQATAAAWRTDAEALAAALVDIDLDEARAALASIEAGVRAGGLDLPTAVLLQAQVLDGEAAVVRTRGQLALARIDQRLALGDDALLGGSR